MEEQEKAGTPGEGNTQPESKSESQENMPSPKDIQEIVGSHLLFGINYYSMGGQYIRSEQFHGIVKSADDMMGVEVKLNGEAELEKQFLPPICELYKIAKRGIYTLNNGEKVVNPDWIGVINYQVQTLDRDHPFPESVPNKKEE